MSAASKIAIGCDAHVLSQPSDTSTRFITEFAADPDSEVDSDSNLDENPAESSDDDDEAGGDDDVVDVGVRSAEWREGFTAPSPLPFTGTSGLLVEMDGADPMAYFQLMFTDEMIQHIVVETNRYASDTLAGREFGPRSRFRKWVDVTFGEMLAFLGLVVAMGLVLLEDLDEYWSTHVIFEHPMFSAVMKRDRFTVILSFLHMCNNREQPARDDEAYDPLFKIRPFISALRENFMRVFAPGKNIAIDEAMIAWRGALSFKVYNPDKPDKYGIQVFELCDSGTGFCHNFEFYTGKKECSSHGATFDVVDRLVSPYTGCGRRLYTDNYYTSPDLFTHLKELDVLACGTMRVSRKFGPPRRMIPKLRKKDTAVQALTNGSLNLLRFHDKREVNILTTAHDNSTVLTGKTNRVTQQPILKLKAVHEYNKYMGAVDRSDQMVGNNAFRRRTIKWWKKGFFHMFMLGILNAYIVQKAIATGKKLSHRVFRRDLVTQLVQWTPIPRGLSATRIDIGDSSLFRLSARHFPKSIVPKPGMKHKFPQRDCVVCTRPDKRMASRYECRPCNVGLHVDPCFELYHSLKDYKRGTKRKNPDQ